jgi:hypothetical protein
MGNLARTARRVVRAHVPPDSFPQLPPVTHRPPASWPARPRGVSLPVARSNR